MMLRRIGALAAVTVLALSVAAPVLAASAAPGTYTLCVTSKSARYESTTKPCKSPEKRIRIPNADELRIPVNSPAERGATGAQGVQGERGIQGPKGDTGARGWQGWRGQTGPRGPVGPAGPIGKTGDAGAPGKDGADGKDGANGGVVRLESLTLNVAGVGRVACTGNVSRDPANPSFSTCTTGPAPTLTPAASLAP